MATLCGSCCDFARLILCFRAIVLAMRRLPETRTSAQDRIFVGRSMNI